MTLRFISLQRRIVLQGHNSQGRCVTGHGITLAQWTSQSNGSTARRPNAPAVAQMVASARILSHVPETEERSPSKTQAFRCFQTIHGSRSVIVARPLCIGLGVFCRAMIHQSLKEASSTGGLQVSRSHARISYQTCLEKGQASRMCCIVSGS
jgi:hypothetical protein